MIRRVLKSRGSTRPPMSVITEQTMGRLIDIFQVLSDPSRLRILLSLLQDGEQNVNAICDRVNQPQPAVSFHLKRMFEEGMVIRRREGKFSFYSISAPFEREMLSPLVNRISSQLI